MKQTTNKLSVSFILYGDLIKKPSGTSTIILERSYYDENGMSDIAKNPCKFWLFVRHFSLRVTAKGKPIIDVKHDVEEITGKNNKQMCDKLEKRVDELYDALPKDATREWMPDDFLDLQKATKIGALKVHI